MDNKCFLCDKKLRSQVFPGNLKFWLERPYILVVSIVKYASIGYFGVCKKDAIWAYNNNTAAEAMLTAKIAALEKKGESNDAE